MKSNRIYSFVLMLYICTVSLAQDISGKPMRLDSICKIKIDSSDYKSVDSLKIIDSVKNEYIIGDVIDFNYVNPTKTPLYVGISLERKDDEDWFLFFNEIFKKHSFLVHPDNGVIHIMPEGGFSINTFSPIKGTKKDCWKVCDCLYGDESIALFRLKYTISLISYGFEFSNKNVVLPTKVCYSKPFYVKKDKTTRNQEHNKKGYKFYSHLW